MDTLAQVEADMNAVERTLELYQDLDAVDSGSPPAATPSVHYRPEDYDRMSQVQAIVVLAASKGGVVTVSDAKQMLVETGKTQSKKPYSIATSIIIRRNDLFEWVGPGTYRLLTHPNNQGHHREQPELIRIT